MSWSHLVQSATQCKGAVANQTFRQLQAASEIFLKSGNIRKQLTAAGAAGGGSCNSRRVLVHTGMIARFWAPVGKLQLIGCNFSIINFLKWCRVKVLSWFLLLHSPLTLRVLKRGTGNFYTGDMRMVCATNIFQKDTKLQWDFNQSEGWAVTENRKWQTVSVSTWMLQFDH